MDVVKVVDQCDAVSEGRQTFPKAVIIYLRRLVPHMLHKAVHDDKPMENSTRFSKDDKPVMTTQNGFSSMEIHALA